MYLPPQALAYLRQFFLRAGEESVSGNFVVVGSLPPNRLSSPVPANLIAEVDPVALPVANEARSLALVAQTDIQNLQSEMGASLATVSSQVSGQVQLIADLQAAVVALTARVQALEDAAAAAHTEEFVLDIAGPIPAVSTTISIVNGRVTAIAPT